MRPVRQCKAAPAVNTTCLDKTVSDAIASIKGYRLYRKDRDCNGGGVAIYIKESRPEPKLKIISDELEVIVLEVSHSNFARSFHVICWYHPPTACIDYAIFEELEKILKRLESDEKEIILIGDTNCDFKNHKNANSKKLKSIYSEYQLEQLIKRYARVAITTTELGEQQVSKTLIDHFSSTNAKNIVEADVMEIGMVDHYLIYGIQKINAKRQKENIKKIVESRNLKKYDRIQFRQDLNQIEWETVLGPYSRDPVNMAATFQGIFESILDVYAPVQKKRIRNHFTPWLTASLKSWMTKRDILKREVEKSHENWPAYRKLCNQITKEIRDAIRDYYQQLIDENIGNPKRYGKPLTKY